MNKVGLKLAQRAALLATVVCGMAPKPASAAVALSPIFGSDMVLQRGVPAPVFGTATPGSTVTVQFQGQSVSTAVPSSGNWRVNLASMAASASPSSLVATESGANSVTLSGVQVGEVWLCSGQSNMGKPLSFANGGTAEASLAANYNIRLFRMTAQSYGPSTTTWQVSHSTSAANFSAVGYWFGLELSKKYNVPIGLIQATHDGTDIANWEHSNGGTGIDYDTMVKAIQPYAIKGNVWYQGESNGGDAAYEKKLTDLISEWRADWAMPGLPFGIVQITGSGGGGARWGQYLVSQKVANTWLVVTADIPGGQQLHPTEKKPIGLRLGLGARATVYGEGIEYSGPIPATPQVSGTKVVLNWTHGGNALITGDGLAPTTFQIAGSDNRYQTATARIVGNTIELTSKVTAPMHVRYQWGTIGNLFNSISVPVEGGASTITKLPTSLFQLDFSATAATSTSSSSTTF